MLNISFSYNAMIVARASIIILFSGSHYFFSVALPSDRQCSVVNAYFVYLVLMVGLGE
jgi:hypothetical protein